MYSLLVSHQLHDWNGGVFRFDKDRFLEYTSRSIKDQLKPLSIEATQCLESWPCVLMEEGRAEEVVRIARIAMLEDMGRELRLTIDLRPSRMPILNSHLWRIRDELDIEQFEFSRYHWSVKDRDLFSVLRTAGHEVISPGIEDEKPMPLPAPARSTLIAVRDQISTWSHTEIDDLLLEAGVKGLLVGRNAGSRRDRANAIIEFSIENPTALTAERSLFTAFLVRRVSGTAMRDGGPPQSSAASDVVTAKIGTQSASALARSPNRVFVVHGQNEIARTSVVAFLESKGLLGVVLHEQPNMGRHLLTKFIQEADLATFAVILMTDDDVGSVRGGRQAPRARQNVILELGYFLSHLGQARVCALITPGLETPSDFDGIVYISMDADGRWQKELLRELRAAKLPIREPEKGWIPD